MPLANGFLRQEDFSSEFFFELGFGVCEDCSLAQLMQNVPREKMFHSEYPFVTSSSRRMTEHFHNWADDVVRERLSAADPFVVEIGSNDGTLLQPIAALGIRHVGVDPSANVAALAQSKGINTVCRFFDEETAKDIVHKNGCADVVLAANCLCHIQDLHSLAAALEIVLKPQGVLIFEDPYLGDVIDNVAYDQIYDEHASYFCILSVKNWLSPPGFEIVDIQPQNVHGGSMRYVVARTGAHAVTPRVSVLEQWERRRGLHLLETYRQFALDVNRSRELLLAMLERLNKEGCRVVGYAATSKSTTVLNYCGISSALLEFISDTTPMKHGKFSPGMHIPVRPHEDFQARYPDYALLFAWNHAEEIINNERAFNDAGKHWIRYVPKVEAF